MKIKITLKDPDGVWESIEEAAKANLASLTTILDKDEVEDVLTRRREAIEERCKRWVQYGEYVTIEIDTDTNTATVCEV